MHFSATSWEHYQKLILSFDSFQNFSSPFQQGTLYDLNSILLVTDKPNESFRFSTH